jgi:hypothetical protein
MSQARIWEREIMGTVCVDHHRSLRVPLSFLRTYEGVTEQTSWSFPRSASSAVGKKR